MSRKNFIWVIKIATTDIDILTIGRMVAALVGSELHRVEQKVLDNLDHFSALSVTVLMATKAMLPNMQPYYLTSMALYVTHCLMNKFKREQHLLGTDQSDLPVLCTVHHNPRVAVLGHLPAQHISTSWVHQEIIEQTPHHQAVFGLLRVPFCGPTTHPRHSTEAAGRRTVHCPKIMMNVGNSGGPGVSQDEVREATMTALTSCITTDCTEDVAEESPSGSSLNQSQVLVHSLATLDTAEISTGSMLMTPNWSPSPSCTITPAIEASTTSSWSTCTTEPGYVAIATEG